MATAITKIQLQEFIQRLNECRVKLEQQEQDSKPDQFVIDKSVCEQLQDAIDTKWKPIEEEKTQKFEEDVENIKKAFRVEVAIIESIRDHVSEEILDAIEDVYIKVRKTNDLKSMMAVHSKNRGDVKIRQMLILINAIYRYNRDLACGIEPNPCIKSKAKYATICLECGETADNVLKSIFDTKVLQLPL